MALTPRDLKIRRAYRKLYAKASPKIKRRYAPIWEEAVKQYTPVVSSVINKVLPTTTTASASTSSAGGGVGPGGITPGSYPAHELTQEQRNWLWHYFGHEGEAPVGYGGEGGGGGGAAKVEDPAQVAQRLLNEIASEFERRLRPVKEYLKTPFTFDEELAREAVEKEYSPYYTRLLEDYMRSSERQLRRSLRSTAEAWEQAGAYTSGRRMRAMGLLKAETAEARRLKERGIEEEKREAIESAVLGRKREKLEEYEIGLRQAAMAAGFPGWGGSFYG